LIQYESLLNLYEIARFKHPSQFFAHLIGELFYLKGEVVMEQFLNKEVTILTCLGGVDGSSNWYKGIVTSVDDEFVCVNDKQYIVKKYILSVTLK